MPRTRLAWHLFAGWCVLVAAVLAGCYWVASVQMAALATQVEMLSTTWRDQENQRFTEEFQQNLVGLSRFVEANNQYIPFLLRKADRIDEYLQQR